MIMRETYEALLQQQHDQYTKHQEALLLLRENLQACTLAMARLEGGMAVVRQLLAALPPHTSGSS